MVPQRLHLKQMTPVYPLGQSGLTPLDMHRRLLEDSAANSPLNQRYQVGTAGQVELGQGDLVINQGKEAKVKEILKGSCLLARDYKGFGNQGQTGVRTNNIDRPWRTLTPTECERLQTIPDGYTSMGATKPISKTQRLKMLGNCWTIKVIEHLFKGLI